MCLTLYLATSIPQPLRSSPDLHVEEVDPVYGAVRQQFSLPVVRFIGAHTGCSCGFPSVSAEEPVEWFDGMMDQAEEREADLRSLRELIALVREHVAAAGEVELYAVWNGEEGDPPKGRLALDVDSLDVDRFFFNERFLYRIHGSRRE